MLLYKDFGWTYVAQHLRSEITAKQCQWRYNTFVQHVDQGIVKSDMWTDAEVS